MVCISLSFKMQNSHTTLKERLLSCFFPSLFSPSNRATSGTVWKTMYHPVYRRYPKGKIFFCSGYEVFGLCETPKITRWDVSFIFSGNTGYLSQSFVLVASSTIWVLVVGQSPHPPYATRVLPLALPSLADAFAPSVTLMESGKTVRNSRYGSYR